MSTVESWLARYDAAVEPYAPLAPTVNRLGLGLAILLAGAHKLVAPGVWHAYLAPAFEAPWPTALVSLDLGFVLFGVSEVVFGALLLADRYTSVLAALTALSLLGVVVNLLVGALQGQGHVDVLVRDVGLTLLAAGVALQAAGGRS